MNASGALPPLRDVIARHGLKATKALGQNFLCDEQLLDRIAAIPGDLNGRNVFEVGPGPGGLTRALLRAGANVVAVEQDRGCIPALAELDEYAGRRLRVIEGDALKIGIADVFGDAPCHIVANLPYNIGTALFTRWLESEIWPPQWTSMALMFQREVALRICAAPGSKSYGRLSVLAQWRSTAKIALPVHRSAFTPPPKVMSAVVLIEPAEAPGGIHPKTMARVTAAAFGQRRKMLRQAMKALPGGIEALAAADIASDRRAETLTIAEFIAIARAVEAG